MANKELTTNKKLELEIPPTRSNGTCSNCCILFCTSTGGDSGKWSSCMLDLEEEIDDKWPYIKPGYKCPQYQKG